MCQSTGTHATDNRYQKAEISKQTIANRSYITQVPWEFYNNMATENQMSLTHFVNKKVIGKAYVQNNVSIFKKGLQFQKVRTQLTNLKLNLLDISPSKDYPQYESVFGYSGAKFYLSQWVTRANQNHLKCMEIGGKAIGLHTIIEEKLNFGQKTIVTGDKFFINDNRLTCLINEVEMQGISCTRQI
jgi:hypothetical protein